VRVSGPAALRIAARLFEGAPLETSESHRAHHGWVRDAGGRRLDEVMALVLRAPRSFTGEDTVEFTCHGNPLLVEDLMAAAVHAGARVAEPGEFTRRAFLNGRLDLSQAEAVADLIAAESAAGRRAALEQLRGALSARVEGLRAQLLRLLADIEASIDFVEEDLEFFDRPAARAETDAVLQAVEQLLATAADGQLLRAGVRVSLAGAPNVGKSSLFNRLLESPRSIVTEFPGTTRDVVRETLRLGALTVALEDTAGLRTETPDPVERLGIERSRRSHAEADVVLQLLDATRPASADECAAVAALDAAAAVVVLNKIDAHAAADDAAADDAAAFATLDGARAALVQRGVAAQDAGRLACVAVSATTGANIPALLESLAHVGRLRRLSLQNDALVTINARHREALLRARAALLEFAADAVHSGPPELLAAGLRGAVLALGEVSGEQVTEDVLDSIFARFCLGK